MISNLISASTIIVHSIHIASIKLRNVSSAVYSPSVCILLYFIYNDTVGNKGKNSSLALIRRQNARLIERLAARIKRITDDPVIEESCNATQKSQILDISD